MTSNRSEMVAYAAEQIHDAMAHAVREFKGEPQPWQNGNSTAESYARRVASDILDAAAPNQPLSDDVVERALFHELLKRGIDEDTADQIAQAVAAAIPSAEGVETQDTGASATPSGDASWRAGMLYAADMVDKMAASIDAHDAVRKGVDCPRAPDVAWAEDIAGVIRDRAALGGGQ